MSIPLNSNSQPRPPPSIIPIYTSREALGYTWEEDLSETFLQESCCCTGGLADSMSLAINHEQASSAVLQDRD